MKYKLLLLLMLVAGVCQGQGVYKYKDVEVACKSFEGPVSVEGNNFILNDSIATIKITFSELHPSFIDITNNSGKLIKFLWKDFLAYGDYKRYYGNIDPFMIDDETSGEQNIYAGQIKTFYIRPSKITSDEMFSKKADGKGTISLNLIVGEKSYLYYFELESRYEP